ncbi:hypothetical protein [Vibrio casei]|uniref:hypothetical protein n=1 Tax=Vibrio casei TaxID=673372 RepID=UPI003F9C9310
MIGLFVLLSAVSLIIVIHQLFSWLCSRKILGNSVSKGMFYVSAFFGTPIHELSHALVAIVFGHRIKAIQLFQLGKDGRFGYVEHQWNRRSVYQSTGVFFIALAPLCTAFLLIECLQYHFKLGVVDTFVLNVDMANVRNICSEVFNYIWHITYQIVQYASHSYEGAGWLLIVSLLCFHCIPSRADFKNALKGSMIVMIIVFLLWFFSYSFNLHHQQWMLAIFNWSVNMSSFIFIVSLLSMLWWGLLSIPALLRFK